MPKSWKGQSSKALKKMNMYQKRMIVEEEVRNNLSLEKKQPHPHQAVKAEGAHQNLQNRRRLWFLQNREKGTRLSNFLLKNRLGKQLAKFVEKCSPPIT